MSSKDKQLILSSLEVNEPAGAEGGLKEELDFLTEILTSPSEDNITVLLWSGVVVRQEGGRTCL